MTSPLDNLGKLNSRLRCVADGDRYVNAVRAQQDGAVQVSTEAQRDPVPELQAVNAELSVRKDPELLKAIEKGAKQTELSDDVTVKEFVLFNRENEKTPNLVTRRNGRVGSATVKLSQLRA
jgi:hypothetical protein